MKINYTHDSLMPELTLSGPALANNGFLAQTPVRILLRDNTLWVTPIQNEVLWESLLDNSDADVAADRVQDDGSLYLAGRWLSSLGVIGNPSIEVGLCDGAIWIRVPIKWH